MEHDKVNTLIFPTEATLEAVWAEIAGELENQHETHGDDGHLNGEQAGNGKCLMCDIYATTMASKVFGQWLVNAVAQCGEETGTGEDGEAKLTLVPRDVAMAVVEVGKVAFHYGYKCGRLQYEKETQNLTRGVGAEV